MNPLRHLHIGPRLALVFGIVIAIYSAMSAISFWTAARLAEADYWNKHTYEVLVKADGMLASMVNMETGVRGFLLSGSDAMLEPLQRGVQDFGARWSEAKRLTADNPQQQQRLAELKARHDAFSQIAVGYIALRRDVDAGKLPPEALAQEFGKGGDKAAMDAFRKLVAEMRDAESALLLRRAADADDMRALNRLATIIGTIAAILVAVVAGMWVARSITVPVGRALDAIRAVARGDLTVELTPTTSDEVGQLLAALGDMTRRLSAIVGTVRATSDTLAASSVQIASSNNDLSSRTEGQASVLEETAASMEELGSTVRHNADQASAANKLAAEASTVAATGGEAVAEVVETMKAINASSRQIAEIIAVIDGIAFQTNILALNAAVEAARAGEQGRGFAVVASEVRALARRSAEAAREIKTLITASVERIDQGSALVDRAGTTMRQVVASIREVSDMVGEISNASVEQSAGVSQVGEAVVHLDQVTQQNATLVQEMATAAGALSAQAGSLVDAVSVFKLAHDAALAQAWAARSQDPHAGTAANKANARLALG